MTELAFGMFVLKNKVDIATHDKISFLIVEFACKNKIGILLDWNAKHMLSIKPNCEHFIGYDLLDSPSSTTAITLFGGDMTDIYLMDRQIGFAGTLHKRMKKVADFYLDVFTIEEIKEAHLYFDISQFEFDTNIPVKIKLDNLKKKLIDFFHEGYGPDESMIIIIR